MPRDISGNYTLPTGNPVVNNTIIDTVWGNGTMNDIASQLNNVLTKDGIIGPTQPLRGGDGTATAPTWSFSSEPNSGLYKQATSDVGISVGGTALANFTPTEIVARTALRINAATGDAVFKLQNTAGYFTTTQNGPDTFFDHSVAGAFVWRKTGFIEAMRLDSAGKLGIGRTPSAALLELESAADTRLYLYASAVATASFQAIPGAVNIQSIPAGSYISFLVAGQERVRIDSSGNVGIGGASQGAKLDVLGATPGFPQALLARGGSDGNFQFVVRNGSGTTLNTEHARLGLEYAGTGTAAGFSFYRGDSSLNGSLAIVTGNAERMRIDAAGNVGIGNSAPGIVGLAVGSGSRTGESYIRNQTSTNDLYMGQSGGTVFGQGPGNIGLLIQGAGKPLGVGTISSQSLIFGTSSAAWMTLDSVGVMRHVGSAVGFSISAAGATPDPYGVFNVTMPANATSYSYLSMTRQGQVAWAIGIDNANSFVIGGSVGGGHQVAMNTPILRMNQSTGMILDYLGFELGYKACTLSNYTGTSTLAYVDRGRCHNKTDATSVTVPAGIFSGGEIITIFNWSLSSMVIVQGAGVTMYLGGTTTTGNRTLAGVSAATVFYQSGAACVIQGAGLS